MKLIHATNAADYLRDTGRICKTDAVEIRELAGGVSNEVLLVTLLDRTERFILKQARDRLRVKDEWLCPPERIWREIEVLEVCQQLVIKADRGSTQFACSVPMLLWQDPPNYLYAMSAAPPEHQTWKQQLLSPQISPDPRVAAVCGQLLASIHGQSWQNPAVSARLQDQTFFDQLRLDPYYRQIARVHPHFAPAIDRLLDSLSSNALCLVHGDFSPKNLLVWPHHALLIDFEVGHFGDPAFDLGFFLTHLALKSLWASGRAPYYMALATTFWQAYHASLSILVPASDLPSLEVRAVLNLAGCMLARIDGKSPVDYLNASQQKAARSLAGGWLHDPPSSFANAWNDLRAVAK